jgi:iron complex outermembrane receptor protein
MNGAAPSFPILGFGSSKIGIERTFGGETTLQWAGDRFIAAGSAFGSAIDNYIYFTPQPQAGQCAPLTCTARGPFPVFAFVPRDAAFAGGEARLEYRAPELPFGISGHAAWVRGYDLRSGDLIAFTPGDRYTLAGRWYWPDTSASAHGYLELNGVLVPRRQGLNPAVDFAPPPPTYALLGSAAGIEFPSDTLVARLSLVGTNLTNARYRDYTNLLRYFADEPGWGLALRFSLEFGDAPA